MSDFQIDRDVNQDLDLTGFASIADLTYLKMRQDKIRVAMPVCG